MYKKGTQESSSSGSGKYSGWDETTSSSEHSPPKRSQLPFRHTIDKQMNASSSSTPIANSSSSSSSGMFVHSKEFECLQHSGESCSGEDDSKSRLNLSMLKPSSPTEITPVKDQLCGKQFVGPARLPKWVPSMPHSSFSSSEEISSSAGGLNWSEQSSYSRQRLSQSQSADVVIIPDSQGSPIIADFATSTQKIAPVTASATTQKLSEKSSEVFPPIMPLHVMDSSPIEKSEAQVCRDDVPIAETPPRKSTGSEEELESQFSQGGSESQDLFNFTSVVKRTLSDFSPQNSRTISIKRKASPVEDKSREQKRLKSSNSIEAPTVGHPFRISEIKFSPDGLVKVSVKLNGKEFDTTVDYGGILKCEADFPVDTTLVSMCQSHGDTTASENPPFDSVIVDQSSQDPVVVQPDAVVTTGDSKQLQCLPVGTKIFSKSNDKYYYPGTIIEIVDNNSDCVLPMYKIKFENFQSKPEVFENWVVERNILPCGQHIMYYVEEFEAYLVGVINVCSRTDPDIYEVQTEDNSVISVPISNLILSEQQFENLQNSIAHSPSSSNVSMPVSQRLRAPSSNYKCRDRCTCKSCSAKEKKPIPEIQIDLPKNTSLFKGLSFVITCDKNEMDCSSLSYIDEGVRPINELALKNVIRHGGGCIVEHSHEVVADGRVYCLSNRHRTTRKYLTCLANQIPCLAQDWVYNCCTANEILNKDNYRLPRGINFITKELVEYAKSDAPLTNKKIYIHEDKVHLEIWTSILPLLGGTVITTLPKQSNSDSEFKCDCVVTGKKAVTPLLLKRASALKLPITTVNWLLHIVVTGEYCGPDSHPSFQYSPRKSHRKLRKNPLIATLGM